MTAQTQRVNEEPIGFRPDSSLIVVGHGSTINPDSSTPTFAHADTIRQKGLFADVLCAFWKEEPSLREVPEWSKPRRCMSFRILSARDISPKKSYRERWS